MNNKLIKEIINDLTKIIEKLEDGIEERKEIKDPPVTCEEYCDYFTSICGRYKNCPISNAFGDIGCDNCAEKFNFQQIKMGNFSTNYLKLVYDSTKKWIKKEEKL